MATIRFSQSAYASPEDQELKAALDVFFNKPVVNKKMADVATQIFAGGLRPAMNKYGVGAMMAQAFVEETADTADIDPHGLAVTIMDIWRASKAHPLSLPAQHGLNDVASQLLNLVQEHEDSPLKADIIRDIRRSIVSEEKSR